MLNADGLVIGVTYAGVDEGQHLNFAIGVNTLKWFLKTPDDPERLKRAGSYALGRVVRYWVKRIVIGIAALAIGVICLIYILKRLYRLVKTRLRRRRCRLRRFQRKNRPDSQQVALHRFNNLSRCPNVKAVSRVKRL